MIDKRLLLDDLLGVISDSVFVIISDSRGNELARYDGRDSIPEYYNSREIVRIYIKRVQNTHALIIELKED